MLWTFNGTRFGDDVELPDGTNPNALIGKWSPWIMEAVDMMDGDGAFAYLPLSGGRDEQMAYDMGVLRAIRSEWVHLQNEKLKVRS